MGLFGDITDSLGLTNNAQQKAYKNQNKQLALLFQRLGMQQAGTFGAAGAQYAKALKALTGGYQNALANSSLSANNAKRSVLDREQQSMGALSQSLTDRGLGNTTLLDNARRGISSSTNRDLSNIDAMLAQIQGQLQTGLGAGQAGLYQNLAGLYQNQASAQTQLGLSEGQMRWGGEPFAFNSTGLSMPGAYGEGSPGGMQSLASLLAFL